MDDLGTGLVVAVLHDVGKLVQMGTVEGTADRVMGNRTVRAPQILLREGR